MSLSELNIDIFRTINNLGKQFPFLNPMVVFIAEYTIYFLALGILGYWFTRSRSNRLMVVYAGIAFILAEIIGKTLGLIYSHNQPFAVLSQVNHLVEHEIDNSFPSDHSILFFSFCVTFFLMRKKEGWLWLILAFLVATSRVWVGVHYPVDVAIGALVGALSALLAYRVVSKLSLFKTYEKSEQIVLPKKKKSRNF